MIDVIANRSAKIIVIDPSASRRQIIADVLRDFGFQSINTVKTGREALDFLEVESADWLLSPLMAGHEVNALQILKVITLNSRLKKTRSSFFLLPEEDDCLPVAHELGLLSWHRAAYSKEPLKETLKELFTEAGKRQWDDILTSACFLRKHLKEKNNSRALMSLELALVERYPGSVPVLFNLAFAQTSYGQHEDALATLSSIDILDPAAVQSFSAFREKIIAAINSKNGPKDGINADSPKTSNVLNLKKCAIISGNGSVVSDIRGYLSAINAGELFSFSDGSAAADWFENNLDVDLIISDWKITKVPTPILLQKIRLLGCLNVPIIVIDPRIDAENTPILNELGIAAIVRDTNSQQNFLQHLVRVLQQFRIPGEKRFFEMKIRSLLAAKKREEAQRILAEMLTSEKITRAAKLEMQAEFALYDGEFRKAANLSLEAIRLSSETLTLINLLGTSLLKQGIFSAAIECFDKARAIAPENVERLCYLAEAHNEIGDTQPSTTRLNEARTLDPDSPIVHETEARIHLSKGEIDAARKIMYELDSLRRLVSLMNNRAVALVMNGRFEDGIRLYQNTLEALPKSDQTVLDIVSYNYGLACARYGNLEQSIPLLNSVSASDQKLKQKAESLEKRIRKTVASGTALQFNSANDQAEIMAAEESGMTIEQLQNEYAAGIKEAMRIQKGDICCHLIFDNPSEPNDKIGELLTETPRFSAREAIDKGESFKKIKA